MVFWDIKKAENGILQPPAGVPFRIRLFQFFSNGPIYYTIASFNLSYINRKLMWGSAVLAVLHICLFFHVSHKQSPPRYWLPPPQHIL